MTQRRDAVENILSLHRACPEAVDWAKGYATLEEVWQALTAPDWALWGLSTFGYRDRHKLRLFAAICAERSAALWDDPACRQAIDLARKAASGKADGEALSAGYLATWKAAEKITARPDWSEAMAAAASAAIGALLPEAIDAALQASRESSRAMAWDPDYAGSWAEEGAFQSDELRRIVGDDVGAVIAEARRRSKGVLHVV